MASHGAHPSLYELERKKSAQMGKEQFLQRVISSDAELSDREYDVTPSSIEAERLIKFSHSGEKYFKILVPSVKIYKDKLLKNPNQKNDFNENDVVQGTYVDNKRVLFGAPHNVYCSAKDVEPIDIDHSAYLHLQKEQQRNKQRHPHKGHQHLSPDEYKQALHGKGAHDEYKIDDGMEEKMQLMDENKPKDPSLSDYHSAAGKKRGYEKVDDVEQALIISTKHEAFYKRYPYNICIACFVFLCLLILDMLLMVFLADLNALIHDMDRELCDAHHLGLIYDDKYMVLAGVVFFALATFCNLIYFVPQIMKREFAKILAHSVCAMLMVLYLSATGWQMTEMNKKINEGIRGISDDDTCNGSANSEYIDDMQRIYKAIPTVTLLKLLQGIALCIGACVVVVGRSRSTNTNPKY